MCRTGRHRGRRGQEGSGRGRSRVRALLNWFCQGRSWGRCTVRRRALRVRRPVREKQRRRRVLVVVTGSPRPMRVVQPAKLWAMTCTTSQAASAGKRPEGRWLNPTPYFRSRVAFSLSAWRRGSVFSFGHVGGALHPVGNRGPVCLGDGLDAVAQAWALAHGDGVAEALIATSGASGQEPGIIARSGPSGPGSGQQFPAPPIQLADMAPAEAAQKGPQGGRRFHHTAQHTVGTASGQRVGVVNAVATSQRRRRQSAAYLPH